MGEAGGGGDLAEEPIRADAGGEPRAEHLQGDPAVVAEVVGQVDRGRAAAAELPLDRVPAGQGGLQALHPLRHVCSGLGKTARNIPGRPERGQSRPRRR